MCWELKNVKFYVKKNGIWAQDKTLEIQKYMRHSLKNIEKAYERNNNILNTA